MQGEGREEDVGEAKSLDLLDGTGKAGGVDNPIMGVGEVSLKCH